MKALTQEQALAAVAEVPLASRGMVIHADGGARPNPGPTGWGIHGYLYSTEKPKKGTGNSGWVLTEKGYVTKADAATKNVVEITPIHYVDGHGSILANMPKKPTNNVGELAAAIHGLEHALAFDISRVLIITDSEYVRKGMEGWVTSWQRNNWVKPTGEPVPNTEYWKELVGKRERLIERGVTVKFAWQKGHSGHVGNDIADKHATLGVMLSQQGVLRGETTISAAEGYWKYDADRHPMLASRRMYFNTLAEYQTPGVYYLGEHGTEDDLLGKRISDGAFSVVRIKEPEPILELVRDYTNKLADGMDSLVMVRIDQLFSADTHKELTQFGEIAMPRATSSRLDLNCLEEEPGADHKRKPLTRELKPPRIAMRAVEAISSLIDKLQMYENRDPFITVTDLTDILYEAREKPVGKKGEVVTTMELREQYVVGYAALAVQANYRVGEGSEAVPVTLTLGIDLLNRNSLKRLEKRHPKVTLISWLESAQAFRYATVIEADGDVGIFAGVYSNLRIVDTGTK